MISSKRLSEFVHEVLRIRNEETEEKTMWEFWLHKVHEKSFADFVKQMKTQTAEPETIPEEQLEQITKASMEILNDFKLG